MGRLLESCEDTWRRRRRGFMWARHLSHYNVYIYHTRGNTLKSIVLLILCYTDLHSSPAIPITVFRTLLTVSRILPSLHLHLSGFRSFFVTMSSYESNRDSAAQKTEEAKQVGQQKAGEAQQATKVRCHA
jgi:hypothetical protein